MPLSATESKKKEWKIYILLMLYLSIMCEYCMPLSCSIWGNPSVLSTTNLHLHEPNELNWLLDYPVILCQSLLFSIVLVGTLSEQRNFWQKIRNIWIHKTCRFQLMWIDFPLWLTYLLMCHYLRPWTTCYLSDLLHFDMALFHYFTFGTLCPKSFFVHELFVHLSQ